MTAKYTKWLPAVGISAVIAAGVIVAPLGATAAGDLDEKTPRELLEFAADADVTAFSATLEQSASLGLPDLSAVGSMGPSGGSAEGAEQSDLTALLDLATGTHTARVYVDGADQMRLQVLDSLAERNVIRSGDDVWYYDSSTQSVSHLVLPAANEADEAEARSSAEEFIAGLDRTPQEIADDLYASVDAATEISVGSSSEVAGRAAYELQLDPQDADTLVDSVTVSIDGETGLALGVEIFAVGSTEPVFSSGFTDISFAAPDASVFDFVAPEGATVTEHALPTRPEGDSPKTGAEPDATGDAKPETTVTDAGWSSVVELAGVEIPAELADSPLFETATTAVDGGRVLQTALVSVLLTDDGRVLAGAVPVSVLQAAAAQ